MRARQSLALTGILAVAAWIGFPAAPASAQTFAQYDQRVAPPGQGQQGPGQGQEEDQNTADDPGQGPPPGVRPPGQRPPPGGPPPGGYRTGPRGGDPRFEALRARMFELRTACQAGDRRACIQFGIIIGENRERRAQWRQQNPDMFWWER